MYRPCAEVGYYNNDDYLSRSNGLTAAQLLEQLSINPSSDSLATDKTPKPCRSAIIYYGCPNTSSPRGSLKDAITMSYPSYQTTVSYIFCEVFQVGVAKP